MLALAWVWRDRWLRSGTLVGLAIASKLFLWPLLVWLLATRRYRAGSAAAGAIVLATLVPWALIGFSGLASYADLLRSMEDLFAVHSLSVATMLHALGADPWVATRAALAVGVAFAALALVVGRRGLDAASLSLAVLAAILGSPILWQNYYALLLVPVAIVRPRFSGIWVAFTLFVVAAVLPRPGLEASELLPGGSACCRPDGVPYAVWAFNHAPPGLWPALGHAALAVAIVALAIGSAHRRRGSDNRALDRS
jgi:hypothetical protein